MTTSDEMMAVSESLIWQATFDAITDMISIQDRQFNLVKVNKAFERFTGLKIEELIGRKCYEVIHGSNCPIADCPYGQMMVNGNRCVSEYYEPRLGIYLEIATSPVVGSDGQVIGSVHVARDVTERKKAEQIKDEFIGLISHELKTPLTVILGSILTSLGKGITRRQARHLLSDAAASAESLSRMIDNLLELSRAQADHLEMRKEMVDVGQLLRSVVSRYQDRSKNHRLVTKIPKGLPPVKADRVRLELVLNNLIDNALKYSPGGGDVVVSIQDQGKYLLFSVKDRGIGIPDEEKDRLFQPFARLSNTAGIDGVGLGLNVCQHLVKAHGGRIWVESEHGQGSTFFFTLPLGGTKEASS
ncbi:MAG: ATP-binding protein [candidate division WOR-3 bacterium]